MCMFSEKDMRTLPQNYGYKVFEVHGKELHFPYYTWKGRLSVPRGKWLKMQAGSAGFHVFRSKTGAQAYAYEIYWKNGKINCKVVRVRIRGAISQGANNGFRGFRVEEIYVP